MTRALAAVGLALGRLPPASRLVWAATAGAASSLVVRPPALLLAGAACALVLLPSRCAVVLIAPALALLAGLGVGAARLAALDHDGWAGRIGTTVEGRIVLTSAPRGRLPRRRAEGRLLGSGGGLLLIRLEPPPGAGRGAVLAVTGRIARPRPRGPGGGFDERAYLARRGIHAVLWVRRATLVGRRGGLAGALDAVRAGALRAYRGAGTDDAGQMLGALAVGADEDLTPATRDAFAAAQIAHLLAVSGQNIAILTGVVAGLTLALGFGRRTAQLACLVVVPAYLGVVGPSPSVVRAAVAGLLTAAAWLVSRPVDRWHLFAVGALVLLLYDPYTLLDPGFQLSFAAVAAILAVVPRLHVRLEGFPVPSRLRLPVAVSVACTLATAPIGYLHFGRLGLVAAVPANLAAEPVVAPLVPIGLAAAALEPVAPGAAEAVARLARPEGLWLVAVARRGARLDAWTARHAQVLALLVVTAGVLVAASLPRAPPLSWLRWPRSSPPT